MIRLRNSAQICLLLTSVGCGRLPESAQTSAVRDVLNTAEPAPASSRASARHGTPVAVAFRNVNLHVDEVIVLEIRRIDGALISNDPQQPPIFDDQRSFKLRIDSGEIAMSGPSLTRLMNDYVFAYDGAPLKNLDISIEDGRLRQKGTLHKGVDVPFSILADVSTTPDGRLRLHPKSVKTAGIPTAGLMKLFNLELDELIKLKRSPGVQLAGNDFLLEPGRLLPSPNLIGHLTSVRIEADRVVQVFGSPSAATNLVPPDRRVRNYMYYRGGSLRFGKLTMSDADMQLIDADPRDVFDFFPAQYLKQLVAGYSKTTPSGGLKVYMPDYNQVRGTDLKPAPES